MGLTFDSTGGSAACSARELSIQKEEPDDLIIALAGNPNVGKSTIFNALTGMHQHTGNWPGKTVSNACGRCEYHGQGYLFVDLPGTYSIMAHSPEEVVARDFICFGKSDAAVVVCDATCLERNLNLVLQVLEITPKTILCLNLMDEAKKKKIYIDTNLLSKKLGIPVIQTTARDKKGLENLLETIFVVAKNPAPNINAAPAPLPRDIENVLSSLCQSLEPVLPPHLPVRWTALRLLCPDSQITEHLTDQNGIPLTENSQINSQISSALDTLHQAGYTDQSLRDKIVFSLVHRAEQICSACVFTAPDSSREFDRKLDRIFLSPKTGIPVMLLLLFLVFWLTITGANYPSALLSNLLFWFQERLSDFFVFLHAPQWLHDMLVLGVYRVLAWVVSVMLPPMAIFFPLFTLLEDFGYLPRVAFNLDHCFQKANACGKQALTMCMGFGCNAAGVVGCRIIDSPRERLIAILTNSLVPCNGRFPSLIALISMFFVVGQGVFHSFLSSATLTLWILLSIGMTFLSSRLLSQTVLKGEASSFALELPPYRRPQIGKVIVRSVFDRTLFVLGRAAAVAAPAGLLIWLLANFTIDGESLLFILSSFLDPFAQGFGIDGVILLAFILGFPANEIVFPLIMMGYLQSSVLMETENLTALHSLLLANGWTVQTAVAVTILFLFHWPCSTTCLTIWKETKSLKWTSLAFLLPTAIGFGLCFVLELIF